MLATIALANLLTRMAQVNADLHSYTATMRADVHLLTFPFLETQLVGTIYRKEPDREKLVITSGLPVIAQQFGNLYPNIASPQLWPQLFVIKAVSDDGNVTRLHLVPRKRGNVDHIDARVADATALVTELRWNYRNGGWAEMTQRYSLVDGEQLAVAQQGHINEPGYVADISATVEDYHINAPIADDVFSQP
jgi:hypothetical protein